jgi:two-component system, OmpR family, alkaline phosphatase synthesis response regulator PhoP
MNKTILLVDYEQKSLNEIQELLKNEQFDLLMAFDGSQALEIFEKKSPDLVITSALLPKLNGFELCKKIVSGQHGEVRPVIMFSGIYKAEKYRKEAIVGCGAVDFLEKPLAKWQLLKVVNGLFSEIPAGPGGGPLELDVTQAPPATRSSTLGSQTSSLALSDDLLEVESLLDSALPVGHQAGRVQEKKFPVIQDTDLLDLKTVSVNPLDQELEAAVDAVRTDLDAASRLRDQRLVEEIEVDLFKAEPNILEFESATEAEITSDEAMTEIIELDAPADDNKICQPAAEQTQPVPAAADLNTGASPQFTLSPPQPRNWLPFLAIILIGLLVVLVLWLRG